MAWMNNVLVVAGQAVGSDELYTAMVEEAKRVPTCFVLVVPRSSIGPRAAMEAALRLEAAVARAAHAGLHVQGRFGDSDPVRAVVENFNPWRVDKIILCSLPAGVSRWYGLDVPARVSRLTGVPVVDIEAPRVSHGAGRLAASA